MTMTTGTPFRTMASVERVLRRHTSRSARSPMLRLCEVEGCATLTMGGACVAHDRSEQREFLRGRPYRPAGARVESAPVASVH